MLPDRCTTLLHKTSSPMQDEADSDFLLTFCAFRALPATERRMNNLGYTINAAQLRGLLFDDVCGQPVDQLGKVLRRFAPFVSEFEQVICVVRLVCRAVGQH